ncbi:hypothetical protein ACIQPQ_34460 [Streptomyces sp. NPDC091281]|uniref:hypothetical protein n=1 Tax=Streptomyces sp. NPDC091281 TaxID=3365985 RepID=UPI00382EAF7B
MTTEPNAPDEQIERRARYAATIRNEVLLRLGPNAITLAEQGRPVRMNLSEAAAAADAVARLIDAEQADLRSSLAAAQTERELLLRSVNAHEEFHAAVAGLLGRWTTAGPPPLGTSVARWWDSRLVELGEVLAVPDDMPADHR